MGPVAHAGSQAPSSVPPPGKKAPNRLAAEPSPYLRQHANNPVDWWPWGPQAFAEARRRDVPVFLSIGYSTCHWCHVMAHESFEDPQVAHLLNEAFVCVKVDREERPDVDDVYMAACQAMTGSGGWPLTVLLTHDKRPFFAGTYFPKESRPGRMGMLDLVPAVEKAWRDKRAELEAQAEHILAHLRTQEDGRGKDKPGADKLDLSTLAAGVEALRRRFDATHAGFGSAPKFPSPHLLLFLLRWHARTGDAQALTMATSTLHAMARGGIHDHMGGGFHRYSTDPAWLLPHFEKMLYDQAMVALAYTEAYHVTGDPVLAATARATLDYVLRDLQDSQGGFHCGEDADSEGEEGRFYVWSRDEVMAALGAADGERFCKAYGVQAEGNFLDEATHRRTGANILHLRLPLAVAEEEALAPLRATLLRIRGKRVRPGLDDKVLTDWNGLAIAAFATAARVLGEPRYAAAATRAAAFLRDRMRKDDGNLGHRYRAGHVDDGAFLDDHAFLLWGLVDLYETTFDATWLSWAVEVATRLRAAFSHASGGYFQSPENGEDLGLRRKEAYDGALPSGNSAAAHALLRLGLLTGDAQWTRAAEGVLQAFGEPMQDHPGAFGMLLCALDLWLGPTTEVVVAGSGPEAEAMVETAREAYAPRQVVLRTQGMGDIAAWTKDMQGKGPQAYVCRNFACEAPVATVPQLRRVLAAPTTPGSREPGP